MNYTAVTAAPNSESAAASERPRRAAVVHVLLVTVTRYAAEAFFLVRGLSIARLLGPESFGVWAAMRLVLVFGHFADLGGTAGMVRLAPHAVGAGDREAAARYRGAGATVRAAGVLLTLAILGAILAIRRPSGPGGVTIWIALMAVVAAAQLQGFYQACLRSTHRFEHASAALFAFALLSTLGGVAAAWRFGLLGFVLALAAAYGSVFAVSVVIGGAFPRPNLHWPSIRKVVGTGFGITIANLLQVVQWNLDKLVLWSFAGSAALGLYTLPTYLTNAVQLVPHAMAGVLYPRMLEAYGRTQSRAVVHAYLEETAVAAARFVCPFLALLVLGLHLPIQWLLPEYMAAVTPGRVLLVATFFTVFGSLPSMSLLALGAQRSLAALRLTSVLATGCVMTLVVRQGGSLTDVACVALAGFALQAMSVVVLAGRVARLERRRILSMCSRAGAPFVMLLSLLIVAWRVIPETAEVGTGELVRTVGRCLIVVIPLIPWAFRSAQQLRHMGQTPPEADA